MERVSHNRCFGGSQSTYQHDSTATNTPMRVSVYLPPAAEHKAVPVLWYLSGLTCTEENFSIKAGAQRYAAELGIALVAPDTSPRGAGIEGEDERFDLGTGAGFYVDATEAPWSAHYCMYRYIAEELPELLFGELPLDITRQGITGHSMGGHGALILALKQPGRFRSVSALAPIASPLQAGFGRDALRSYLGPDESMWRAYDTPSLLEQGMRFPDAPLIDQGSADDFKAEHLKPELLLSACQRNDQAIDYREHSGYDHGYYFVASFIGEHVAHHAQRLHT